MAKGNQEKGTIVNPDGRTNTETILKTEYNDIPNKDGKHVITVIMIEKRSFDGGETWEEEEVEAKAIDNDIMKAYESALGTVYAWVLSGNPSGTLFKVYEEDEEEIKN